MMHTPILETKRLLLRPFELKDLEEVFYGWESDPEVAKYMFWKSHNDLNKSKEWEQKEIILECNKGKQFIKVNNAGGDGFETFGNRRRYALS